MGIRLSWLDNNVNEEGYNIYRGTAPMDPAALPVPIATLGPDVTQWEDGTVTAGATYYYRIGTFTASGTVEKISDEIVVEAVELAAAFVQSFDNIDLSLSPDNYDAQIASLNAEMVASFRNGAIAEADSLAATITAYGQHKWPQSLPAPIARMWVLSRDNVSGEVLRVYAERDTPGTPNEVITQLATWTFQALWRGQQYTGTGTWHMSNAMGGSNFSTSRLSNDDGTWAFKDGANTHGNQGRPAAPLFGPGNWNSSDSAAVMSALTENFSNFQGIVIFAPLPGV